MINQLRANKLFIFLITASLLILYFILLAQPLNLVTADLGRHLKNGQVFLENLSPITTNFYSYSFPDFFTVNHHWGSGVIFYLVWLASSFVGLHLFFITLSLITFLIFFRIAASRSGILLAAFCTLLVSPLLAQRIELRPEVFSYLFLGIFFWLLLRFREDKFPARFLIALPVLSALWINLHIYFFLGSVLVGVFLLEQLIVGGLKSRKLWQLLSLFVATILAALINPWGLQGLLIPFQIFQNFGYSVIENQPVWFIEDLIFNPSFIIFKALFALLVLSFITILIIDKQRFRWSDLFLAAGFSLAAWFQIRNFVLFALFALPIMSGNFSVLFAPQRKLFSTKTLASITSLIVLLILLIFTGKLQVIYSRVSNFQLGVMEGNDAAARFIQDHNISGPIYNDYDIGGYLIFHLFPKERVYVDNRPEAYPGSFFSQEYIPAQQDDGVWQALLEREQFNVIIFSRNDATPWGQQFLRNRSVDKNWAPVFLDQQVVIYLRRVAANQTVIDQYEVQSAG